MLKCFVFFCGTALLLSVGGCLFVLGSTDAVYVETGNLARDAFRGPEEWLIVICYDSTVYKIMTHEDRSVGAGLQVDMTSVIETLLKKDGLSLIDAASIIHNHQGILELSEEDRKFLWQLKRSGFQGKFGLYLRTDERVHFDW